MSCVHGLQTTPTSWMKPCNLVFLFITSTSLSVGLHSNHHARERAARVESDTKVQDAADDDTPLMIDVTLFVDL